MENYGGAENEKNTNLWKQTRRNGENFRIRINGVSDDTLTGEVISGTFFFNQPFELGDTIQFEKKNVIDIYDIDRWGILI